jgi:hypothetical protein
LVNSVVCLQVGELLNHRTQDFIRDLVHERTQTLDGLILHLPVGVYECV